MYASSKKIEARALLITAKKKYEACKYTEALQAYEKAYEISRHEKVSSSSWLCNLSTEQMYLMYKTS